MKTAISIPDKVFEQAEKLARVLKKSRSQLYSEALAEYLRRRDPDRITAKLDELCAELDREADPFGDEAARRVLERSEW